MRFTFNNNPIDRFSCWFHNNIVVPLARWHDSHKKTHYECCVCGELRAPYFEDLFQGSLTWDYGWYKLDDGSWICHHCADHGYAPNLCYIDSFEYWYDNLVMPHRARVRELIKTKDPEYYNNHCFYDDEESVKRDIERFEKRYG